MIVRIGIKNLNFGFDVLWLNISIPRAAPNEPKMSEKRINIFSGIRLCFILAKSLSRPKVKNVKTLIDNKK